MEITESQKKYIILALSILCTAMLLLTIITVILSDSFPHLLCWCKMYALEYEVLLFLAKLPHGFCCLLRTWGNQKKTGNKIHQGFQ